MRGTCADVRVITAALVILLTGWHSGAAAVATAADAGGVARAQRRLRESRNESAVTSYYQHDPYGPNTYAFGYEVNDNRTGNVQFRDERRYLNGSILGSYGYVRPDGRVTITNFISDKLRGYLSQTQTYSRTTAAGDDGKEGQSWLTHWPTMRPEHLLAGGGGGGAGGVGGHDAMSLNATHDEQQHLNVSVGGVSPAMADALQQQHGMLAHVQTSDVVNQVLAPSLLDILNGQVPVQKKPAIHSPPPVKGNNATTATSTTATVGFETVHNFIPSDFPLMPFEPPQGGDEPPTTTTTTTMGAPFKGNKYDRAKENNAEKTPHEHSLTHHDHQREQQQQQLPLHSAAERNTPAPLSGPAGVAGVDGGGHWYERIINATRREFLQNLPELQ